MSIWRGMRVEFTFHPGAQADPRKLSEIIATAREAMEKYGWRKSDLGDEETGVCTLGSFNVVCADGTIPMEAVGYVAKAAGVGELELDRWNDDPFRTESEVLEAFRVAEKMAVEDGK